MRNGWLAAPLLLLAACGSDDAARLGQPSRKPLYFDVKGLLDAQVVTLSKQNPAVEKKVQLRNGQLETTRVPHVDWSKELAIFYQADINKTALRGAYTLGNQGRPETPWFFWQRRPGIDAPVVKLTVVPSGADTLRGPVELLTAVIRQDNPLFYSEKTLELHARQGKLMSYEVRGVQKLVLFDTVRYSVSGRIL